MASTSSTLVPDRHASSSENPAQKLRPRASAGARQFRVDASDFSHSRGKSRVHPRIGTESTTVAR